MASGGHQCELVMVDLNFPPVFDSHDDDSSGRGLTRLGDILGLAGGLVGSIDSDRRHSPAMTSGFNSLPAFAEDFLGEDQVFQDVVDYYHRGYQGRPMVRLTAEDDDPVFGNRSLQEYQDIVDYQTMLEGLDDQAKPDPEASAVEDLRYEMMARSAYDNYASDPYAMNTRIAGGLVDPATLVSAVRNDDTGGLATIGRYLASQQHNPAASVIHPNIDAQSDAYLDYADLVAAMRGQG